jgi:hypothetical protein
MCGAYLHSFCAAETSREIEATDATVMNDQPLCSVTCYRFSLIDGLSPDTVTGERVALAKKNKEQLKKEARECGIKVNCRINGVSRDASKEVIVARLLEKRILQLHPSSATLFPEEVTPSKFTINDKFRLINVIFSEELSDLAIRSEDTCTRAELDAGLVGHKSQFWTMVESCFNEGFPPDSVDGMTFGDLLHQLHPLFHQSETKVDPSNHGKFSAEKLLSVWKDLLKEYDTVMVNFTKSGNHDSSFTRAAMVALKKAQGDTSSLTSSLDLDYEDDLDGADDEFGLENGGWCSFTNSLPIIYLRMWLNEKPNLTSFVSRQIPPDVQLDTAVSEDSRKKRKASDTISVSSKNSKGKKSPSETIAEAIAGLVKVKELELAQPRSTADFLVVDLKHIMESQSTKERIELLEKQISVVTRKLEQSSTDESHEWFQGALVKLEEELDNLVLPN